MLDGPLFAFRICVQNPKNRGSPLKLLCLNPSKGTRDGPFSRGAKKLGHQGTGFEPPHLVLSGLPGLRSFAAGVSEWGHTNGTQMVWELAKCRAVALVGTHQSNGCKSLEARATENLAKSQTSQVGDSPLTFRVDSPRKVAGKRLKSRNSKSECLDSVAPVWTNS